MEQAPQNPASFLTYFSQIPVIFMMAIRESSQYYRYELWRQMEWGVCLKETNHFLSKPYRWAVIFSAWLTFSFAYILLDAFVIPRAQTPITSEIGIPEQVSESQLSSETAPEYGTDTEISAENTLMDSPEELPVQSEAEISAADEPMEPMITATSYQDSSIAINIQTMRAHDTNIYIADIQLTDPTLLRTAFADDTFGRNIKATTSATAQNRQAILAVNGDNYGSRDNGFVLRNGAIYRDRARSVSDDDALLIDNDGFLHILDENTTPLSSLENAWQVLTFGPALIRDGEMVVDGSSEVTYSPHSNVENPRTAIGQIEELHYVMIVTDGRTGDSRGLTLLELAEIMTGLGCETAYNLDGGGSSTMVFMGEIINQPTSGRRIREREINDIVYIGYE